MSEVEQFTIGSEVECSDGACGALARVVVDPVARALTHLVVEPRGGDLNSRLVPVELVESSSADIRLHCTTAEFAALDYAVETEFLPATHDDYGYGEGQALTLPYFGLLVGPRANLASDADRGRTIAYDRVPAGEVEVRRGEHVHATDGDIGRVQGLVIDPSDHRVTHVLLDEGHLWGAKRVAIPVSAVKDVDGGVHLDLTTDQVRELPAVALEHDE